MVASKDPDTRFTQDNHGAILNQLFAAAAAAAAAARSPLSHLHQQQPVPPQWGMSLSQPHVSQNSQGMKAPKPVNHQHHKHASLQKVNS
jgi:hypothetical protein